MGFHSELEGDSVKLIDVVMLMVGKFELVFMGKGG